MTAAVLFSTLPESRRKLRATGARILLKSEDSRHKRLQESAMLTCGSQPVKNSRISNLMVACKPAMTDGNHSENR